MLGKPFRQLHHRGGEVQHILELVGLKWWVSRTLVVMAIRNHCTRSGFEPLSDTAHSCGHTHPTSAASAPHTCGMAEGVPMA